MQSASRARSVGVYRQRDADFPVGAVLGGVEADAYAIRAAVRTVPALTPTSGLVVALHMYETHL